jgi:WhiB family redox-sensing transcriptional regulator
MNQILLPPILEERPWVVFAVCREADAGVFFDETHEVEAKTLCAGCPVREECLEYALDTREPYGVWGGYGPKERRRLLRRSA